MNFKRRARTLQVGDRRKNVSNTILAGKKRTEVLPELKKSNREKIVWLKNPHV